MTRTPHATRVSAFLIAATALGAVSTAAPASAEVSFKDKRIDAIIASRPGDGTDVMMRLLGPRRWKNTCRAARR